MEDVYVACVHMWGVCVACDVVCTWYVVYLGYACACDPKVLATPKPHIVPFSLQPEIQF